MIHLHGRGFRTGHKSFYARALLHQFAQQGWVCISANYRLRPGAAFPDFVVDAKRIIAGRASTVPSTGPTRPASCSRGTRRRAHRRHRSAHREPRRLPAGVHPRRHLGGRSDRPVRLLRPIKQGPLPSSPADYIRSDAPPMFIAHGDQDTLVFPEHARLLVARLRATSTNPVVYAELPGAQHSFDMFRSIRFEILIDGIRTFA